jgi:peptidoglycan hydrolase-like protein with peptidoglycan-binding domain
VKQAAWLVLGMAAGALVAGGALIGLQGAGGGGAAAAATPEPVRTATANVERRDMRSETELDGTLGYADAASLVNGLAGTLTSLPAEGRVLRQGDRVMEVDGRQRSGLLYGSKPAWRRMAEGMSDGTDVIQLERALRELGYLPRSITPDREYDEDTARAVRRWQHQLGVTRDGVLEPGEVVFVPGPVRVGTLRVEPGERVGPGTVIASVTSTERIVRVLLDAEDQGLVATGDTVTVELPDGARTPGTVHDIGTVASTDQEGGVTIPVTITLDDPDATGTLDGAPVTVLVIRQSRDGVLAVPVDALLALREGGYAVQVADPDGGTHYVGVRLGLFTDGWVEITGDITDGARVVVPA